MYSKKWYMNRHKKYKSSNREGNTLGMFPSENEYGYTRLYNNPICNDCLPAYQKPVYEYQKEFILRIKKSRKEEIMKFFRERMYVNHACIQSEIGYMQASVRCMNGFSILTAFMEVFPVGINVCIPEFQKWIKRCKHIRDTYLDTGFTNMNVLMECIKRSNVCI